MIIEQFQGIVQPMGEHDAGKTLFALQCGARVDKICLFDDDIKGRSIVKSIEKAGGKFGAYHDLVAIAKDKLELKFFEEVRRIIDKIKPGEFDAIVWDTWSLFASKTHPYVVANEMQFRTKWNAKGEFHGGQQWQEARLLEAKLINQMAELTKTLILITHLKESRIEGVKIPGKFEPNASPVLERIPNLRIWLRHNPNSPVPIGLVLKRFTIERLEDGIPISINVLPQKITPHPEHRSLWQTIQYYIENPVDMRPLRPDEMPDRFEMSILSNTLTEEQKHTFNEILRAGIHTKEEDESIASSLSQDDLSQKIKEMLDQKKSLPIIAKELGITISDVKKFVPINPEVNF